MCLTLLQEAVNINQSLFVLRRVITALSRNADEHLGGKWENDGKTFKKYHLLMSYGTIVVPYFQPNGPRCSRVKPWVVAKQLWSFPRHVPYRESKLPLSSRAGLGRTEDPKNRDFP